MRGQRRRRAVGHVLIAVALVSLLLSVFGCSQAPVTPKPQSRTGVTVLGPYPIGVRVQLGRVGLTLVDVRIQDASATVGPFITKPSFGPPQYAPAGTRFVDVTVRVDDASRRFTDGGSDPFRAPVVIADGKTIKVGSRGREMAVAQPYTAREQMEFAVPPDARSVILRLPLTTETSAVPSFRLW